MDPEAEEKVEVAPEPQDQAKPVTDEGIQDIASRLAGTEGAPEYDDIADWKNAYGVIYASTIHMADDLFIFRPLKRLDYKKIVASGAAKSEDKCDYIHTKSSNRIQIWLYTRSTSNRIN